LKVLSPVACHSEVYRDRFQREARAAARLHHTNIVPIFGVGEDRGALYYAMQFIQGQSLDAVLEDVKRMRGLATTVSPAEQPTLAPQGGDAARGLLTGEFRAAEPHAEMGPGAATAGSPAPLPTMPVVPPPADSGMHSGLTNLPETRYYRSIAWLGVQLADGLAHAHAQGILHRDIKPSNLLLDAQGTLWITDFGLAKTQDSGDLTHTGEMVGTLRYMAPERFEGRGDVRSDVYAVGVTLYEMLTLAPPFTGGDRVSLMAQITSDTPLPPSRLAPLLPRDLETIVLKAMARDPAARYATARDLADDLRRFVENRPIKARRSTVFERASRWCRRNPMIASLLGALFFLLFCLTVGSLAVILWLNEQRHALLLAEARAEGLYPSLVGQARTSRFSHRVGQRFATLEAVRKAAQLVHEGHMPAARLDELRTLAIAALALPDLRTIKTWDGCPPGTPAWDADDQLRLYARSSRAGVISLRRVDSDEEIARLDGLPNLRFSPAGRFLLAYGYHRFQVWDVSTADPRMVKEGEEDGSAFHPDGRHLLMGRRDGSLWTYDLGASSAQPSSLVRLQGPAAALAYDPAGTRLAAISEGKVQILNANTGKLVAVVPDSQSAKSVAWHPSGNYLALTTQERDVHIWDLKRMSRMADPQGYRDAGGRVAFTPDGDGLLGEGGQGVLRLWEWRTGRPSLQYPGSSTLQFGPEGRLLIQDGDRLSLVALTGGREYRSFALQTKVGTGIDCWMPRVHPEGRLLAVAMTDGTRLFDLETGDELAAVPETNYNIAFQNDGALLTNGSRGLLRWPIHQADPGRWQVGPPDLLDGRHMIDMASDQSGAVIGQATGNGALLVRPGKRAVFLGPHGGAQHISISPDGTYAATGINDGEEGVKLWHTQTRRLLVHFPLGRCSGGVFSPDGRLLAVSGDRGWRIIKVGTWDTVFASPRTAGGEPNPLCGVFSPDGAIFAPGSALGVTRMVETATGRELVRLEEPNQAGGWVVFTPDGTRLLTSSGDDKIFHVWDLRAIRVQLAEIGLDWDAPPYPEAEQPNPLPLEVRVDLGNAFVDPRITVGLCGFRLALNPFDFEACLDRGRAHGRLKENSQAVADYSMALALMPADYSSRGEVLFRRSNNYRMLNDQVRAAADLQHLAELDLPLPAELQDVAARQCNNLAWRYLTAPKNQRDPQKALPLAQRALKLDADGRVFLNTLGVAYYRLAQYRQAVETLERSLREGEGEAAAFDLFFLAMCHARQGAARKARNCFDQAVQWVQQNPDKINTQSGWGEELTRFRAEAEECLKDLPNAGR
jgi:serine/threonine protein kinase/WD40 repeat protein/tetratricopeptide (TPR) repeat protein